MLVEFEFEFWYDIVGIDFVWGGDFLVEDNVDMFWFDLICLKMD